MKPSEWKDLLTTEFKINRANAGRLYADLLNGVRLYRYVEDLERKVKSGAEKSEERNGDV